jgi:hypothetical protein
VNPAGLYVVPAHRRRKPRAKPVRPPEEDPTAGKAPFDKPRMDYMWRDESGEVKHRTREWTRPQTVEAIADWMEDYLDRLSGGYMPEGFTVAPVPFCARITLRGRVLAQWKPKNFPVRAVV